MNINGNDYNEDWVKSISFAEMLDWATLNNVSKDEAMEAYTAITGKEAKLDEPAETPKETKAKKTA